MRSARRGPHPSPSFPIDPHRPPSLESRPGRPPRLAWALSAGPATRPHCRAAPGSEALVSSLPAPPPPVPAPSRPLLRFCRLLGASLAPSAGSCRLSPLQPGPGLTFPPPGHVSSLFSRSHPRASRLPALRPCLARAPVPAGAVLSAPSTLACLHPGRPQSLPSPILRPLRAVAHDPGAATAPSAPPGGICAARPHLALGSAAGSAPDARRTRTRPGRSPARLSRARSLPRPPSPLPFFPLSPRPCPPSPGPPASSGRKSTQHLGYCRIPPPAGAPARASVRRAGQRRAFAWLASPSTEYLFHPARPIHPTDAGQLLRRRASCRTAVPGTLFLPVPPGTTLAPHLEWQLRALPISRHGR